jgi:hypothetical protein
MKIHVSLKNTFPAEVWNKYLAGINVYLFLGAYELPPQQIIWTITTITRIISNVAGILAMSCRI